MDETKQIITFLFHFAPIQKHYCYLKHIFTIIFLETKHIHIGFSFSNQEENKLMKLILDIQKKDVISSTKHVPKKKNHLLNMPLKTVQLLNKFGIKFQCNVIELDRYLASEPKTIEVVKISFPQGLFLIAIS